MSGEKQFICAYCDKEKLSQNEIGLNKRLIHRQIERMMCLTCMAKYFEMEEENLEELIERFERRSLKDVLFIVKSGESEKVVLVAFEMKLQANFHVWVLLANLPS